MLSLCLVIQRSMRVTQSYCEREQPLNFEKMTSSVLSVLLFIF